MNPLEQQLLDAELGGAKPLAVVRTRTPVDVGLWWRHRPLWLCVTAGEIILLAVGRRRYCEHIPIHDCRKSFYNPASSELVIAPIDTPRFTRLKTSASQAIDILDLIRSQITTNTTIP